MFEVEDEITQAQLPIPATCCPPPQLPLWSLLETKANPSSSGSCLGCGVLAQPQKSSEYKGRHSGTFFGACEFYSLLLVRRPKKLMFPSNLGA